VKSLCLPARVLGDLALGPADESSANSMLGVWAEIGTIGISVSTSKLVIGEIMLSRAYIYIYRWNE
jgi:hypothetical protein